MFTRAKLHKTKKTAKWAVDLIGQFHTVVLMPLPVFLRDGSYAGRWYFDSWQEAHRFLFGGCSTCRGTGKIRCLAHQAGDGCNKLWYICPDCAP